MQIRSDHVDVIGFQEVRGGFYATSASQISDLRSLLPGRYRWSVYVPANNVTFMPDSILNNYPCEGKTYFFRLSFTISLNSFQALLSTCL